MTIDVTCLHLQKALVPIELTLFGISICVSFGQSMLDLSPLKALALTSISPAAIFADSICSFGNALYKSLGLKSIAEKVGDSNAFKIGQSPNAESPNSVTVYGNFTTDKLPQYRNASSSIVLTPTGNITSPKLVHFLKADRLILFKVDGHCMLLSDVQPSNARISISTTPSGKITSVMLEHSKNAPSPIFTTGNPLIYCGTRNIATGFGDMPQQF